MTNYFTIWVEAKETKTTTFEVIWKFIKENILVRFGIHIKLEMNNVVYFSLVEITEFFFEYGMIVSHPSDNFPQGNDQAKSSNKNVINIIKKLV